ncbi:cuticle protein 7-like [Periplaneta americana]|uniref:cuticle protein 7-like n=1 Tax=Periplaneta americana TaxID=6978 RepID=UPI0037E91BE5
MKFLVVVVAALACALAEPDYVVSPYGFSYSSAVNHYASPYAYSVYAAPHLAYGAPVSVATAYHAQDAIGQASYGHVQPHQAHHAVQDAAGNKVGSYSFVTPEGKVVKTNYIADANGYHVTSNAVPVGPSVVPVPVVDTPEVAAAKAAHLLEVEKVKARVRRAVVPASTAKVGNIAYSPPVVYSHPVAYSSPYVHPYHVVY